MKVALVSLDQVWEDKTANKSHCERISYEIKQTCPDVDLIIYPELTLTGFSIDNPALPELVDGASEAEVFFSGLSKRTNTEHLYGFLAKGKDGGVTNRLQAIGSEGHLLGHYDKMHTFSYAGESEYIRKGKALKVFDIGGGTIGATICFDLRFPEIYQAYRHQSTAIVNIANWPSTRTNQWLALLQARAIETQGFVIGVNRTGEDGKGLKYERSSAIFDPQGDRISPAHSTDEWELFEIDLETVKVIRKNFPFIDDRQQDIYRKFDR